MTIIVDPHNMKISFRRHLFDGSRSSDEFVLVPFSRGMASAIVSTLGVFIWLVRPRADLSGSNLGMEKQVEKCDYCSCNRNLSNSRQLRHGSFPITPKN